MKDYMHETKGGEAFGVVLLDANFIGLFIQEDDNTRLSIVLNKKEAQHLIELLTEAINHK